MRTTQELKARNAQIVKAHNSSESRSDIAKRFGMSVENVRKILLFAQLKRGWARPQPFKSHPAETEPRQPRSTSAPRRESKA